LTSRLLLPLSRGEAVVHAADLWHAVAVPTGERWSWVVWFRTCARCSLAGSAEWYRERAERRDDPVAMFLHARRLALSEARGSSASAWKQAEAARWLLASAQLGFGPAAHQLGLAHTAGEGVRVDLRAAARWLAAATGLDSPSEPLGRLAEFCGSPRASYKERAAAGAAGDPAGCAAVTDAGASCALGPPLAGGPSASARAGVDLAKLLLRGDEMGWPNPLVPGSRRAECGAVEVGDSDARCVALGLLRRAADEGHSRARRMLDAEMRGARQSCE